MPMTPQTQGHRAAGLGFLLVTAFGWGLNWAIVKVLLAVWPPLFSRGVSGVIAAALLAAVALVRGERLGVPRGAAMRLSFAAFTNVFVWMGFGTMAMNYLRVSEAALLAYTMPIWAMLFAWPIQGVKPTARDVIALVLGMAGIVVLFGGQGLSLSPETWFGVVLALSCAILFALGGALTVTPLPMPPVALVAWQVGLGCVPMVLLGLAFEHPDIGAITPGGVAALIYMIVVPMGLSYLTWFAALAQLPASTAAIAMLLVPVIGIAAAAIGLGEPLGWRQVAALVLTLAGVALALRKPKVDQVIVEDAPGI